MAYTKYSLTPANNTAAPPDGAPEGMLPSAVNDTMRDMMAQIRDCGDGIRGGTYTMTAPIITGGTINGATIGATTASTGKFTAVTNSALTSGRVTYAGTAGVLQDDADFTFNGTTVTMANDASISGLTVGKGGGALSTNTAVGNGALAATNTNGFNVAIGQNAFNANTTGQGGVAIGSGALQNNTTGNNNTATGINSLLYNTTGQYSSAFGTASLQSNTTGSNNVACGYGALQNNTTASNNTAVGYQALYNHTTGGNNTALGFSSGFAVTTGSNNLNLGYNSGAAITTGTDNITIGFQAANWSTGITTGSGNIFIGTKSQPNANTDSGELVISTGTGAVTGKGTNTGYFYVNGSIYQGNNSSSWATVSDRRIKKNITDNNVGLEKLTNIKVRNFEYRLPEEVDAELKPTDTVEKQGVQLGVIAQELAQVLPECVKTESTGVMTVDTTNLTWYLINAIKELNAKVEAQALEIATLKGN